MDTLAEQPATAESATTKLAKHIEEVLKQSEDLALTTGRKRSDLFGSPMKDSTDKPKSPSIVFDSMHSRLDDVSKVLLEADHFIRGI